VKKTPEMFRRLPNRGKKRERKGKKGKEEVKPHILSFLGKKEGKEGEGKEERRQTVGHLLTCVCGYHLGRQGNKEGKKGGENGRN